MQDGCLLLTNTTKKQPIVSWQAWLRNCIKTLSILSLMETLPSLKDSTSRYNPNLRTKSSFWWRINNSSSFMEVWFPLMRPVPIIGTSYATSKSHMTSYGKSLESSQELHGNWTPLATQLQLRHSSQSLGLSKLFSHEWTRKTFRLEVWHKTWNLSGHPNSF